MTRERFTLIVLAIALLASNAIWLFRSFDAGITQTYSQAAQETTSEILAQTLAVLPVAAADGATRVDVIAAAQRQASQEAPYEKDGFVWIRQLGLKFDSQDRLVSAIVGPPPEAK